MIQNKNYKWAFYPKKITVMIKFVCFFLVISCNHVGEKDIGRKTLVINKQTVELPEEKIIEIVSEYKDVYNAETGHWFSYPKSFQVINNNYGDTMHLVSTNNLVIIKKWTDLESMPISYFDKDGDGDVDTLINRSKVIEMFNSSVENYISQFKDESITKLKTTDYERLIQIENENNTKLIKVLLCNVVGGTLIPVFLEVEYNTILKDKRVIEDVVESFKRKYISTEK